MPPVFSHGDLRLYLLNLLDESPRHGYDLMQALSDRTGGTYTPSAGTIYPRLAKLEEEGLVTKTVDGRKTVYAITDAGRAELEANSEIVEAAIARLTAVGEETQRTDSASVRRAMGNLRQVLMNRLGDRDLDNAALHDIVALSDEAAQKIERL